MCKRSVSCAGRLTRRSRTPDAKVPVRAAAASRAPSELDTLAGLSSLLDVEVAVR